MSKSRLEKFLYALYSLDPSDLPTPLSRIEELYKCLVTGEEVPNFKPLSRVEKYLMAILGAYNVDELPNPLSRVEVLLYKLATGDDNLDDVEIFLSEHEELLADIIRNGGTGGNIDNEYVLYNLSIEFNTLYNTAEKPVKSAILKGQTLVNLAPNDTFKGSAANRGQEFTLTQPIQPNKQYILLVNITKDDTVGGWHCRFTDGVNYPVFQASIKGVGLKKVVFTTSIALSKFFPYFELGDCEQGRYITMENVMLLEYQQGMENWDIPYFEGMQSVKTPVLKVTGKNFFDGKLEKGIIDGNNGRPISNDNYVRTVNFIKVQPNMVYTISEKNDSTKFKVYEYDENFNYLGELSTETFTTKSNTSHIKFRTYPKNTGDDVSRLDFEIMLETGNTVTPYEPFKSNILTVNEEVELRGIGDVKDELDLTTGKLTQRIECIDKNYINWIKNTYISDEKTSYFITKTLVLKPDSMCISNKIPYNAYLYDADTLGCKVGGYMSKSLEVRIENEKLDTDDVQGFIKYLTDNDVTFSAIKEQEVVKTVDLSVVDQDGNDTKLSTFNDITHVTLSSEALIPEAELEVATKNEEDLEDTSVYTVHTLNEGYNTLYNTAEKPVKSAILKGQTLVNLIKNPSDEKIVGMSVQTKAKYDYLYQLDTSKLYTLKFVVSDFNGSNWFNCSINNGNNHINDFVINGNGTYKVLTQSLSGTATQIWFYWNTDAWADGNSAKVSDIVLIEGNHTQEDIDYFEGMQSVKMPVLTTTGKNLFDGEWEVGSIHPETGGDVINENSVRTKDFFVVESNKEYTISNDKGYTVTSHFYDYAKNLISISYAKTFITPSNSYFVKFRTSPTKFENDISIKFQIEQGSISTSYEPFKSNILTVNEEVELRGIGEVKDELNLLTGELTQRIGEIVLDGSEETIYSHQTTDTETLRFFISCFGYDINVNTNVPFLTNSNLPNGSVYDIDEEGIFSSWGGLYIRISKTRLMENSVKGLKNYLQSNPITVQYQLAKNTIKTVDLSVVDQDGNNTKLKTFNDITHVTLSSEGLIPEAELEVAEKVPEVAASMLTISREQEVIDATTNEQSENVDATMIATTEIYEDLL